MNYYDVIFHLSSGKNRVVKDVKSETYSDAKNKAIISKNADEIVIEIEDTAYEINRAHLIEIVVEKVDSPDERERKNRDSPKTLSTMKF